MYFHYALFVFMKMTADTLTILIPTYARTSRLQEALWCAINQTIPVPIIVLSDCSRQTLVCDHPLVTIVNFSEQITSLGEKRNALLRFAATEWVTWLDDEDWLLPWYVEDLTQTFSENLDAVLTTRCWHAYGSYDDGAIRWAKGTALFAHAVRLQKAKGFNGFPDDSDFGEDRAFYTELIKRGRACSLLTDSGYCCHRDSEVYPSSGFGNDRLAGVGVVKNAEFRLDHGLEPSGRIVLSPSLRNNYFENCPDKRWTKRGFAGLPKPQESLCQRTICIADRMIKVIYPQAVEKVVELVLCDFETGLENFETPSLIVKYDRFTGRYSLSYLEIKGKSAVPLHDLGHQLLFFATTALFSNLTTGLAVYAGAVAKKHWGIVLPGIAGVGKSFLTAWFLKQSYSYLSDLLICIENKDHRVRSLQHPLSFKKSGRQHLDKLLSSQKRTDIIEGITTDLLPWQQLSNPAKDEEAVTARLLVFPEFRSGADLSIEALTPAQGALLLLPCVANGRNLPGHGLPYVTRICKTIPALRLIYGDCKQLVGVLDRLLGIILDYNLSPADLVALTVPFNRHRHNDELLLRSAKMIATTPPPEIARVSVKVPVNSPVPQTTPKGPKKKLTIGMATYDDFDGVYFSVQAIRLYHSEVADKIEILVVDNHPDGLCAKALKNLDTSIPSYRYLPEQGMTGTAVRDLIFREAVGEFVLCMDCHVMIVPGALQKLMKYLDGHQDSRDLLQGPLVNDDLTKLSTHFTPIWRKGMYGVWETDERGRESGAEPFEIPMQGLGLFCCRREAWPGFNPRFRGFGGEEGYLHQKFRKNGGRTLCLPFLRWLHRFARPLGTPYKNRWEDRIHNYMVGFQELGLEIQAIEEHFTEQLGKGSAERIFESIKKEMQSPFFFFDAIYCITLDTESEQWQAMLPRLQALGISDRIRIFKAIATPENHHIGCALSHRGVIAYAKHQQLKNVLVFEDDAIFLENTLRHLADSVGELKQQDWNIFYLGGHRWGQSFPFADGCSFLQRPKGLTCTHALAYNSSIYDTLLEELPESLTDMTLWVKQNRAIDQYLTKLDKVFLSAPSVSSQIELLPQEDQQYRASFAR
jgi:glycosyltransferase involved in cell wall biosynthesis